MRPTLRMAGVVVLASVGSATPAQEPAPPPHPPPPARETTLPPEPPPAAPATARRAVRRRPIHDSIDRVVDAVVDAHLQPCDVARQQGVPCFPVSAEREGPRFSVAEALRRYRATGGPAPGVPTRSEIQGQMSGAPQSASGGVGFDPVCTAKNLVRRLSGGASTFYLYRMWDGRGEERPLLTDHEIDPRSLATNPAARYDLLGKFDGECAAVAAWRQALRKATEPKPRPGDGSEAKRDGPPE